MWSQTQKNHKREISLEMLNLGELKKIKSDMTLSKLWLNNSLNGIEEITAGDLYKILDLEVIKKLIIEVKK